MPRIFVYCRVSTADQTTQNQSLEIQAAGFAIEACRLIEESISGSVAAKERPGFIKLRPHGARRCTDRYQVRSIRT